MKIDDLPNDALADIYLDDLRDNPGSILKDSVHRITGLPIRGISKAPVYHRILRQQQKLHGQKRIVAKKVDDTKSMYWRSEDHAGDGKQHAAPEAPRPSPVTAPTEHVEDAIERDLMDLDFRQVEVLAHAVLRTAHGQPMPDAVQGPAPAGRPDGAFCVAGVEHRLEVKHQHDPVGHPALAKFVGELPSNCVCVGHFVSTSGFTDSAKSTASDKGVQLHDLAAFVSLVRDHGFAEERRVIGLSQRWLGTSQPDLLPESSGD